MKESLERIRDWAQKHPWLAALILGVVVIAAWMAYRRTAGTSMEGQAISGGQEASGAGGTGLPETAAMTPAEAQPVTSELVAGIPIMSGMEVQASMGGGGGGGKKSKGGGGGGGGASPLDTGLNVAPAVEGPQTPTMQYVLERLGESMYTVTEKNPAQAGGYFYGVTPKSPYLDILNEPTQTLIRAPFSMPRNPSKSSAAVSSPSKTPATPAPPKAPSLFVPRYTIAAVKPKTGGVRATVTLGNKPKIGGGSAATKK